MQVRIQTLWEEARASYWFVPGLMVVGAIFLSFATIALDGYFQSQVLRSLGFIWSGGAEGARGLLQTVAGSMITVAGVTFSITMVALSLASSQYGSRLLRNFMADTGNQIVLGTFISTFIYCLLVLRTVRGAEEERFIPYLSVTIGLVLALVSLVVLIYFIHHMALSMQAPYIIGEVAGDLFKTIERLFPSEAGSEAPEGREQKGEQDVPQDFIEEARPLLSKVNGYIQAIDEHGLLSLAQEHDLIIQLPHRPGHFITEGDALAQLWPAQRVNDSLSAQLQKTFIVGRQRTHTQDVEFAVEQLVEVAERSLSSGINASFTAITCIDWLGAALAKLLQKDFPSPYRYDEQGSLRIFLERPLTAVGVINTAFNQIRQSARDNISVRIRLLEKIALLYNQTDNAEIRQALERQAEMIERRQNNGQPEREDRQDLHERYDEITNAENDR